MKNFLLSVKLHYEFIISFFLIFYVSLLDYYNSVDKVSVQWIYLSIVSCLVIGFFYWSKITLDTSKMFNKYFSSLLVFFIFCCLSFISSDNIYESLISLSRLIIIFVVMIVLFYMINHYKPSFILISYLITIVLFSELLYSVKPLLEILSVTDFVPEFSTFLKGVTGNKNITSAIFAVKIPFVFYVLFHSRFFIVKAISFILIVSTFVTLFFISTRGILLSIFIIYLLLFFILLYKKQLLNLLFLFLPLVLSLFIFNISNTSNNSYSITQRVSSITTPSESSVNTRLRYYSHALDQIIQTPFIGIGLGNWKIKSVDFDKENILGYTVPYNAHNDLLEIGAETGLGGLISYLLSFFLLVFILLKKFQNRFISSSLFLVILSSLFIYFVDLNLNFPTYRPAAHVNLMLLVSIILNLNNFYPQNEKS